MQRIHLALFQLVENVLLLQVRFLGGDLCFCRLIDDLKLLLHQLPLDRKLLRRNR